MKIISALLLSLCLIPLKAQQIMPTSTELITSWYPNTELNLAGYYVKIGTSSGVYSETFDAGLPEIKTKCDGARIAFKIPMPITVGKWYSVTEAYNAEGQISDPSEEIEINVRPVEIQYSSDNVNWRVENMILASFTSAQLECEKPSKLQLITKNTQKIFRYFYRDELTPPATLPILDAVDIYLNWTIPDPSENVLSFKIYKQKNGIWELHGFAYPPYASYRITEYGVYSVTSVNSFNIESDKSNSATVYFKPEAPTSARVLPR
jgi:hypothetical protein